jgi:hypothetical protein
VVPGILLVAGVFDVEAVFGMSVDLALSVTAFIIVVASASEYLLHRSALQPGSSLFEHNVDYSKRLFSPHRVRPR